MDGLEQYRATLKKADELLDKMTTLSKRMAEICASWTSSAA